MRRQLDLFGDLITVVVGKYNELSEGGHILLDAMALGGEPPRLYGLHA